MYIVLRVKVWGQEVHVYWQMVTISVIGKFSRMLDKRGQNLLLENSLKFQLFSLI